MWIAKLVSCLSFCGDDVFVMLLLGLMHNKVYVKSEGVLLIKWAVIIFSPLNRLLEHHAFQP